MRKNGQEAKTLEIIARIHTDFPTKFGIPRQSGLTDALEARIVMEQGFRDANCLRGIEGWSHLWLLWQFDKTVDEGWSPTVLPPKLGGKTRIGVFATRSPFRPNAIGLSCVKLLRVEWQTGEGPVLVVSGADMVDGTPIFDIKPYVPYADCHPEAVDAFAESRKAEPLQVVLPEKWAAMLPHEKIDGLRQALSLNPRPGYQHDPNRRYGFNFAGFDVRFSIDGDILTVVELVRL